jgi:hypothetical protein
MVITKNERIATSRMTITTMLHETLFNFLIVSSISYKSIQHSKTTTRPEKRPLKAYQGGRTGVPPAGYISQNAGYK